MPEIEFPLYHKINGLYKRHREGPDKGRFIEGEFATPEFEYLFHSDWYFTEKIDGTNCRITAYVNNSGEVETRIGGRTDNAQLHVDLVKVLDVIARNLGAFAKVEWTASLEKAAEKGTDVQLYQITLYGEGYGAGIQKGGDYRSDKGFILFDVKVGSTWLEYFNVEDVGQKLGLDVVPLYFVGTLSDAIWLVRPEQEALSAVALENQYEAFEGLVGVPKVPLFDRRHNRIITKVKRKDFPDE